MIVWVLNDDAVDVEDVYDNNDGVYAEVVKDNDYSVNVEYVYDNNFCFVFWPLAFFSFYTQYTVTVFPLGVLYPEHWQLAFDFVVIACSLDSISGLQGPQCSGLG